MKYHQMPSHWLAVAALLSGLGVHAQVQAQPISLSTQTGGELGLQLSKYNYTEQVQGQYFMSLDGPQMGLYGAYTHVTASKVFWRVDGELMTGRLNYNSQSTGSSSGDPSSYIDSRFMMGRDFNVGRQVVAPFIGVGYRYLYHDGRGASTTDSGQNYYGYRRYSTYVYVPIGATSRVRISDDARISTTFELDPLLKGTQVSKLSDAGSGSDITNQQDSGYGLRLAVAYEKSNWSAGVYYHYWDIAKSNVVTVADGGKIYGLNEPANVTREFGVQVKYLFH